jgi:membrane protease YdiL (CAAX protease family)
LSSDPSGPSEPPRDGSPPPPRPGASTFTIEGRAAPALFVVGWLATIIGAGLTAIAVLSRGGSAAALLLVAGLVLLSIGLVAGAGSQAMERRARATSPYVGPSPFLVFAATVPISLLAVVLLGIPLTLAGVDVDGPLGRLVSVVAQALIYVGLVRLLVVDAGALDWRSMGVRRFDRSALIDLAHGAAYAAPVILVTLPIAAILSLLFAVRPDSPLPPSGELAGTIANLIAGAVVAPIGEELFFRAFATTAWARAYGARRALIQGALFFAAVHILTTTGGGAGQAAALALIAFATRIPVALTLGWIFLRQGSIWASIGLHGAFNGILLILAELAVRNVTPA